MSREFTLKTPHFSEFLIIILPVSLLFSNIISEVIVFILILILFFKIDKSVLKKKFNSKIFFFLLLLSAYFIFNYFINFEKDPSFLRSFFFIRFPLYTFAIYLILENFRINIKRIFTFWFIILTIILFDILFQYNFGKNILGYQSILHGDFMRLGGFLDDELKISNLIIHLFVPIFSYYHFRSDLSKKKAFLLFLFFLVTYIVVLLTGERSNFITFTIFIILYILFTNLRKFLIYFLIIGIPIFLIIFQTIDDGLKKRMINSISSNYKESFFKGSEKGFLYKNNQYFAHYSAAFQINKDYPLFGVGLKNFRVFCKDEKYKLKIHPDFQHRYCSTHPHNFYFEIISEAGYLGLALFIVSFFYFFCKFFYLSYKKKNYFLFGNSLILFLFFLPILPRGSFFTNWNAIIFWTIFSFCLYSYKLLKR